MAKRPVQFVKGSLTKAEAAGLTQAQRTSISKDPPEEKIDGFEHRALFNSSKYPLVMKDDQASFRVCRGAWEET